MNGKEEGAFQLCTDTSDCVELSFASGLYLKPITKLNITVTIPHLKSGQVISNKEIIEKLRIAIRPDKFAAIKATKSNLEFLRFDAELDNKKKLEFVVSKIDQKGIKLTGFTDILKIRASEGKIPFPSRHDWNSYFKEAKHMNEKKPGERPDTVHIKDIPCEWFIHNDDPTGSCPSPYVVSKVFSSFGEIRALDIPCLDPYRKQMSSAISGITKFAFKGDLTFDLYVQYKEYIGFAKCMHMLQAKKLVIQRDELVYMANIKVDFDKMKHLADATMKRREIEREKLMSASIHLQEKSRMKKEISAMKKDAEIIEKYNADEKERKRVEEKEDKKRAKEEKRKQKEIKQRLKKLMSKHKDLTDIDDVEGKLMKKVAIEERKLVVAQRSAEAVRFFDKIFDRIKIYHQKEAAIKTTMHASGIQSEPLLFGNWFNGDCQSLMKRKKALHTKFMSSKSNENWLHFKKCSHKLKKLAHNQKLKFMGTCLKNAKGVSNKELDEQRRRDLVSCKKVIKLSKARQLDHMQAQQKRVDKVMRGKIQVIFLPCDDENKVALSPASSGDSSSSTGSSPSDDSDSDKERKKFAGKMRADQLESQEMYRNQMKPDQFQGQYFHGNFRPRGHFGMGSGQPFPYDNRGRGFRFFRPYYNNRGFRGGPHQGFENRGRGFYQFRGRFPYDKNRGRGGHVENTNFYEHPIQLGKEKWFKRGNEGGENEEQSYYKPKYVDKYQKSRQRSNSWSQSRSGSRNRSRSWSRSRSRSYSKSRSGSEKRRSSGKSPSSKKGSRRRTRRSSSSSSHSSVRSARSNSGEDRKRKSKRDRSWSRSSDSSRPKSRHRTRSEEKHRNSRSESRNRYSDQSYSRSPSKYKNSHKRNRAMSHSFDDYSREYSDVELSEAENEQYDNYQGHHFHDKFVNHRFNNDFRGRGRGPRQFYNYRGNPRQRRPRGVWRGRGRGYINQNYNQNEQDDDYNEQYLNLYKKYFNRITEKDSYKRDSDSDYDAEYEYNSKISRRRGASDNHSRSSSPTRPPVPLKKRLRHYGSSESDEKSSGRKVKRAAIRGCGGPAKKGARISSARKHSGSSESDNEKVNPIQQRERDLRERLSRKLESKKLLVKVAKKSSKDGLLPNESVKKDSIKSKVQQVKDRQTDQIDDMNARYREEEERARADKLHQKEKIPAKWRNKRNIRERLDDSEDSAPTKRNRKRSYSVSDEDSLYGPLPPSHIQSRPKKK